MEKLNYLNFFNQVKKFLSSQIITSPDDMEHNINYQILMDPMCLKVNVENSYYSYSAKIVFDENNKSFVLEEENYYTNECEFDYSELLNEVILNSISFHEELLNLINALNGGEEMYGR